MNFKLYNEVLGEELPINFVWHPDDSDIERGWFVFEKTLIILNVFEFQLNDKDEWHCIADENREILSLDEYISLEIEAINQIMEDKVCEDAVVLIHSDNIENAAKAKNESRFLIYNDDPIEKLKEFCTVEN